MTRPYELLARFGASGQIIGVSVRTITTVNGRDYESDPTPLSGADDPAFTAFADLFSASAVAQRDQLLLDKSALETQVTTLTAERDTLSGNLQVLTGTYNGLLVVRDELVAAKQALESQLAAMTMERDGLQSQLATITADRDTFLADLSVAQSDITRLTGERDSVTTERDTQAQRIIELEAQLDALLNPPSNPRHLAPFDFLALLKPEEIFALQTSVDPTVVVGRAKLQTIITFVDLDHQTTIDLVRYMEAAGLCEPGRSDQILAGEPPT